MILAVLSTVPATDPGLSGAGNHLDVILLCNLALGVVLPTLVAVVTQRLAGASLKSMVLLAFSAIGGVLTQVIAQNGDFHWKPALISFGLTFISSVGTHYGVLKPTGITGTNGAIQVNAPGGLGGSVVLGSAQPTAPDTAGRQPS